MNHQKLLQVATNCYKLLQVATTWPENYFKKVGEKLDEISFCQNIWIKSGWKDTRFKVKNILKDNLDSFPSPSVKIQIIGGKNFAGWCQQTFCFQNILTMPKNVLPLYLKQTFPPIIWIFTEVEGDGIDWIQANF